MSEIFETTGSMLFYLGIGGMILSIALAIIFIPVFSVEKRHVMKKIDDEFNGSSNDSR